MFGVAHSAVSVRVLVEIAFPQNLFNAPYVLDYALLLTCHVDAIYVFGCNEIWTSFKLFVALRSLKSKSTGDRPKLESERSGSALSARARFQALEAALSFIIS